MTMFDEAGDAVGRHKLGTPRIVHDVASRGWVRHVSTEQADRMAMHGLFYIERKRRGQVGGRTSDNIKGQEVKENGRKRKTCTVPWVSTRNE